MRSSSVPGFALVLSLACTERTAQPADPDAEAKRSEPQASEPQASEPPAKPAEPDATPSTAPAEALDVFAAPSEVFEQVSRRWCESGSESFRPPGPPDEEWPPRLEGCADIEVEIHSQLDEKGLRAWFVTLSAPLESRELVLLQSADHALLLETYQAFEDTSGEAGTVLRKRESIELRDLTGTPTPEWIAKVGVHGGDSFEADRCYSNVEEHRSLIVCSEAAGGFACAELSYWEIHTRTPRPEDLDECGIAAADLDEKSVSGFAQDVELARDRIVLKRGKLRIDEPGEPSYEGEVSLASLLADPLPAIAGASRPKAR